MVECQTGMLSVSNLGGRETGAVFRVRENALANAAKKGIPCVGTGPSLKRLGVCGKTSTPKQVFHLSKWSEVWGLKEVGEVTWRTKA